MSSTFDSYEWYLTQDFSRYAGKWIAIVGRRVVASADTAGDALREAHTKTSSRPLLAKIVNRLQVR
ncbi:MAG: succinyl-CoA synthetase subunit alpha [Deltaproteobacteria bacterium]|nr:succinyl-CoA synthetase subunit alpha [Deltaproteobacteria bacterium]